jgi:hypothetical protein
VGSREDITEKLLQNLYLNVPGTEIDRLRKQIEDTMRVPYEDIDVGHFVISVGDQNHFLCFAASWQQTEELLREPTVKRLLGSRTANELSSMAVATHKKYYESGESSWEASEPDMLCGILLQLAKTEKPDTVWESPRRLMIVNLSYRKIDGSVGILFSSLWKKPPGLSRD